MICLIIVATEISLMEPDPVLAKTAHPPIEEDHSTKKARFRKDEGDEETSPSMSFKDKLMEEHIIAEEEMVRMEDNLILESEDVVIEREGHLPQYHFHRRFMLNL